MKKRVLYVTWITLFLLAFFTVLSGKIEDEMGICTMIYDIDPLAGGGARVEFPLSILWKDDWGSHLYGITEGSGWDTGMRVREIEYETGFKDDGREAVFLSGWAKQQVIRFASRQPVIGEEAAVPAEGYGADRYLLVYQSGLPQNPLPEGFQLLDRSDNVLLLRAVNSSQPFLEQRAKSELESQSAKGWRIYSLGDMEDFIVQLPTLAILVLFFLFPVVLWLFSGILILFDKGGRTCIGCNIGLSIFALKGLPRVLSGLDLPSSLLPPDNIFRWGHYETSFRSICSALDTLKVPNDISGLLAQNISAAKQNLLTGCILTFCVLLAEMTACHYRHKIFH